MGPRGAPAGATAGGPAPLAAGAPKFAGRGSPGHPGHAARPAAPVCAGRPDLPGLAWRLLRAVDERQAYANLLLPKLIEDAGDRLDARDRTFVTELGYGALRWQGSLDLLLSQGTRRPLDAVDPPVRDALRLAAYQLLRTRVPARAAVASAVELVRSVSGEPAARFANAVLRRAAERVEAAGGDLARRSARPGGIPIPSATWPRFTPIRAGSSRRSPSPSPAT